MPTVVATDQYVFVPFYLSRGDSLDPGVQAGDHGNSFLALQQQDYANDVYACSGYSEPEAAASQNGRTR